MRLKALLLVSTLALALGACDDTRYRGADRHNVPIPASTMALMASKNLSKSDPILIRSFKKEAELEVWKRGSDGRYALLKTYPMCRWSGQLGPKLREGDRQAPEGFYAITPAQMNPNSSFYLSFNMGYPNQFDRSHGRTGAHLMVHGACSSAGCYSMTDDQIAELYALVREAHRGGQRSVQMQALPFRMTAENLAKHRLDRNIAFWRNLKEGSDIFEVARLEPKVSVCNGRYAFERGGDCQVQEGNQLVAAAETKRRTDDARIAALVSNGTPAIRLVYDDGDQHESFKSVLRVAGADQLNRNATWASRDVGVSRPDALTSGPRVIVLDASGRPRGETRVNSTDSATVIAAAQALEATPSKPAAAAAPPTPAAAASAVARAMTPRPSPDQPAAAPQQIEVARAEVPAANAAATGSSSGFLARVMSFNPFAGSAAAAPEAPVAVRDNAVPQPTRAPIPPRRADAGGGLTVAARP